MKRYSKYDHRSDAFKATHNKEGHKKTHKPAKPKRDGNKAIHIDPHEVALNRQREYFAKGYKSKQPDGQTYNWAAFGGIDKKLASSPLVPTRVRVKRKEHKRFSEN